jgi:NADPH2:quinone reductase
MSSAGAGPRGSHPQHAVGVNHRRLFSHRLYAPAVHRGNEGRRGRGRRPGVTNFTGRPRRHYFTLGGYASERVIPADKLVKLPDHITLSRAPS